jgi:gliding motility-associated lipoprotein GldH
MGYDLELILRNAVNYPYGNIYVQYEILNSEGVVLEKALESYQLFDQKSGEPFGDGLGDLFDHEFEMQENYHFPQPGSYTIRLTQFMRMDNLPLILSVGISIDRSESDD